MSSFAFGHLQLGASDKINDPFLVSSHSKPNAAAEDEEEEAMKGQRNT